METSNTIRKANNWYNNTDFDTMERISGIKLVRLSDEDDCQKFVDDVDNWWRDIDCEQKVAIYNENN